MSQLRISHFAMTTFCWLPPERFRSSCSSEGVLIFSLLNVVFRGLPHLPRLDEQAALEAIVGGHCEVVFHAQVDRQAEALAVLRQVPDPVRHRVFRGADGNPTPANLDRAALDLVRAEDRPGCLGPAGSHQPRDAEDLSLTEIEADVPHQPPRIQPVHPKDDRRTRRRRCSWISAAHR